MNKKKKIAFFKKGPFSHTNTSIYKVLKYQFSDYEIEVIDILEKNFLNYKTIKNIYFAFLEYGFKLFSSKKNLYSGLIYNSYIFHSVKSNINKLYTQDEFAFTFQTQSQYDMSIIGVPHFVYTDHTSRASYLYPDFNLLKESYSKKWLKCEESIYHNAEINFTMSEDISRSMIQEYKCDSTQVVCAYVAPNANIPNVVNIEHDRYVNPHILFVGKHWEPKGGPTLLEAFVNISKKYPNAKLTIVGCTPDINVPNCNIVGRVAVSEVSNYFKEASIFCLPTRREAFGIVFLEAMAHGLPVLGSNIGAIPEFIIENKNGYIANTNDIDGFTENLLKLIESPERCKKFGLFGRTLFLEKYTWNNVGSIMKKNILNSIKVQR